MRDANGSNLKAIWFTFLIILFIGALDSQAMAQAGQKGLSFKLGETDLYPTVRFSYERNSNYLLSSADETASSAIVVAPKFEWVADRRLTSITASYSGVYQSSSEIAQNFDDHDFYLNTDVAYSKRQRGNLSLRIGFGHEPLGLYLTHGVATSEDEQVEYKDIELNAEYIYGGESAKGNVAVGVTWQMFDYTNRADLTEGGSFKRVEPFALFSYRISSDTRALTELRFGSVVFDNNESDYDFFTVLGGVSFAATGKLTGVAKVGLSTAQLRSNDVDASTELVFEAELEYLLSQRTKLGLSANRAFANANGSSTDQEVADVVNLSWIYRQSERVVFTGNISRESRVRVCPNANTATVSGFASVSTTVRRWLVVGVGASSSVGTSEMCLDSVLDSSDLDFEQQNINIFTEITL